MRKRQQRHGSGRADVVSPGVRPRVVRVRQDLTSLRRLAGRLGNRRALARRVVRWMVDGYQRVNAGDLAAALAFNAMLAIVPTMLLLITLAGVLLRSDDLYRRAVLTFIWILPAGLGDDTVQALIGVRSRSGIFGVTSLIGFVWVGATFFACLGRSMNAIYGVPDPPPVQQRIRGFAIVVVFAVLFIVTVIAAALPSIFLGFDRNDLPFHLHESILASGLYRVLSYAVAIVSGMVLFGMLFRVVPNAGQRLDDVFPGTVVTATLFVALVQVFPLYLRFAREFSSVGSTFALAPLLLAWFYLLAHLILFGVFINASFQTFRRRRAERRIAHRGTTLDRPVPTP